MLRVRQRDARLDQVDAGRRRPAAALVGGADGLQRRLQRPARRLPVREWHLALRPKTPLPPAAAAATTATATTTTATATTTTATTATATTATAAPPKRRRQVGVRFSATTLQID